VVGDAGIEPATICV